MRNIELRYGRGFVTLPLDEERFEVLTAPESEDHQLSDFEVGSSFDTPISSPSLEEIVGAGDSVLLVVSDATRATASSQIINLLVRRLIQYGVAPGDIAIIFSVGIHRAVTNSEKLELLSPFIVQRIRTLEHDAYSDRLMKVGSLPSGVPIELNPALQEYKHVIITGGVSFHYFAGFTGGRKSICPGLASARTIEGTHMLALDKDGGRSAGVGTGLLDGNAVHEACDSVTSAFAPAFGINTVVDENGQAIKVYAGHWREAHRKACDEYLANHSITINEKRDVVIASCGGLPWDINLIQAHKTMDMATFACRPGGTLILLAECRDGLGRPDFMKWFDSADSRAVAQRLQSAYEVNGQTAWSLLTKAETYRVFLISNLPDDEVRKMRMTPAASVEAALAGVDRTTSGFVVEHGATLLPRVNAH
jgi:nickel-dependent lactate racemase